ncbi:helix-turn-helix domain-containing protein [Priestia flexa]|uniref:helix-turn-helix domain-containing protein n=1 Tax=Priestia flexa TaxID=86664 RepID=UPI001F3DD8AE|nr:helix-turn-helix domain-containing protein [Priestia flexa]
MAKKRGAFRGKPKKYHAEAKGKDRLAYKEVVRLLGENESVMNIHRETGLARNTIYAIKKEFESKK